MATRLLTVTVWFLAGLITSPGMGFEPAATGVFSKSGIIALMRNVRNYQSAHPWKETDRNWIRATYFTGVMALYRTTGDPEILAQARHWAAKHQWAVGNERDPANRKTCGQTYLELYFIDRDSANIENIRTYVDARMKTIAAGEPPTNGWYYCDTLYVGPPTIAMLGKATGDSKYFDYLNTVYWAVTDHLFDKQYGLFYRDKKYFNAKSPNGKKVFWSRGNGWVIAGIPRLLEYLPRDNVRYKDYVTLLQTLARSIAERQGADGLWRSNLEDPAQYPNPETSGSAFFCYAFAWGINHGILDRNAFLPVTMKAWGGLAHNVHPDGKLGYVQPVGAEPKPATPDTTHEYAMGAFLLAGEQMVQLIDSGIIQASDVQRYQRDVREQSIPGPRGSDVPAAATSTSAIHCFAKDGGWCWFQDPRAIIHNDQLITGSVTGSGRHAGDIRCSVYDLAAEKDRGTFVLHERLEADDHAAPAFYVRPDGRILSMYAYHNGPTHFYRLSEPNDPTRWGAEQSFKHAHAISYMNLIFHAADNRLYNFFRDSRGTYCPAFLVSPDHGTTWQPGNQLIYHNLKGRHRPYPRYFSDGDSIHISFTQAHPQEYRNGCSIYYARFRAGKMYRADGTLIKDIRTDGPLLPTEADLVYQGDAQHNAWTSSIVTDDQHRIYVAYSVNHSASDHRFRYAMWNGKHWLDHNVAYAGAGLYPRAYDYTGLITIDPTAPGRIYFSTNVDPVHGTCNESGKHEMFVATTKDSGATWSFDRVTHDSAATNMRPVCVVGKHHIAVLWMRGRYSTYTDYDTDIVGTVRPR